MTPLIAAFLGLIEGITEFLPISSTAHLILASHLMHLPSTDTQKSFEIIIQLGSILAVIVLYAKRLLVSKQAILKVLSAFIPTGVIGLLLNKIVKKYFFDDLGLILWALLIGGVVLILVDLFHKEATNDVSEIESITYPQAITIGVAQALAVIPGVSRSGATIVAGLLLKIKRKTVVEFSFLLAIPTMLAATGLDLVKSASSFSGADFLNLGIGFAVSFIVALLVIRWFIAFIQKNSFVSFGIYRIAIAIAGMWMLL